VALGLKLSKGPRAEIRDRVSYGLRLVELEGFEGWYPAQGDLRGANYSEGIEIDEVGERRGENQVLKKCPRRKLSLFH
jgi:hypothetical protein